MFDFIRNQMQQQRRRKALTARLRRFTAASGTSPKMPSPPAGRDIDGNPVDAVKGAHGFGTLETFEQVNRSGVWSFTYDPFTTTRGAL